MKSALLLLYVLDSSRAGLPYDTPTIGFGISFPGDRLNPTEGIEYKANSVYIGQALDEEDMA